MATLAERLTLPVGVGLVSSLMLWLVHFRSSIFVLLPVLIVWIAILVLADKYMRPAVDDAEAVMPLGVATAVSFVGLISLVEWQLLYWFLIILVGIVMILLYRYPLGFGYVPSVEKKPFRRMMMVLWVFDTYALVTTLFAIGLFFPSIPFWFIAFLAGLAFAYSSFMIWRMYAKLRITKHWFWLVLIGVVMLEFVWVMNLLPFGYLASGFLVTWLWYIIQLLIRFHFGPRGIVWKRQAGFLITNFIMYILILIYFVRWV